MKTLDVLRFLKQFLRAQEGQAIVFIAFAAMALMLMAGLGVDVGYLQYQRQQMRKAADAGAIAAASVLSYTDGDITKATQSARNEVAANGFTDGSDGVTVTVNNPPLTAGDPFAGNPKFVEVIVAQPRPAFFMRVAGWNMLNVQGRAVSTLAGNPSGCIYALDPSSPRSLLVNGNVRLTSNCGIYVNSNDQTEALRENGSSSEIIVSATGIGIGVVGQALGDSFGPPPVTGMPPFTDPLIKIPAPAYTPPCNRTLVKAPAHNFPGVYCGMTFQGNNGYILEAGTYVIYGGGLKVTGTPTIVGNGVTFYNTGTAAGSTKYGPITFNGNPSVTLTAPTGGPLTGMLFFQDRAYQSTRPTDTSTFSMDQGTYQGAVYLPGTPMKFSGNTLVGTYTALVAWQIEFTGSAMIGVTGQIAGGSPIQSALLVE